MAIAFVQQTRSTPGTPGTSQATPNFGSSNTAGNLLVAVGWCADASVILSVTDTLGNTWLPIDNAVNEASANTFQAFFVPSCKAGTNAVTIHKTGSSVSIEVAAGEYSLSGGTPGLDKHVVATGNSTAPNSGNTAATTVAAELIWGYGLSGNGDLTQGTGFTSRITTFKYLNFEDKVVAGTGVQAAAFTMASGQWACGVATFFAGFSISGSAGVAGAVVSYSGTMSGSVVADGSGNYSTPALADGSYTITPTLDGYTFSPTSSSQTMAGSNITGVNFTATYAPSIGVWQPQGTVIAPVSADTPGQPNVLYEANPVILSANMDGKIFKMWFGTKNGVCYAESNDGLAWTRYGSNPIVANAGQVYPKIFKNAGTYYLFHTFDTGAAMQVWTSSDGIAFTVQNASALAISQAWEQPAAFIGQLGVVGQDGGGVWWGLYTSFTSNTAPIHSTYALGQAHSTDLIHWTKTAAPPNPIIYVEEPSNCHFFLVNGVYYLYSQIVQPGIPAFGSDAIPSDITRYIGTNDPSNQVWTPTAWSTYYRNVASEGVGSAKGQVADPSLVNVNGDMFMYYTVNTDGTGASGYQINCAKAVATSFVQLVQGVEGVADVPIPSSFGFAQQMNTLGTDTFTAGDTNWTQVTTLAGYGVPTFSTGSAAGTGAGIKATAYYNAASFQANQWVSIKALATTNLSAIVLLLRTNTSGVATFYQVGVGGPLGGSVSYSIYRVVGGVATLLKTGSVTVSIGDILTGAAVNETISLYVNDNLIWDVADNQIESGAPGILLLPAVSGPDAAISSFSAGNFGHSIGGNAGVAGATVSYTGTSSGSVVADGSGSYSIPGLADGSYTITPSFGGYTFSPISSAQTVAGANITGVDFTATQTGGGGSFMQAFRQFANKKGGLS